MYPELVGVIGSRVPVYSSRRATASPREAARPYQTPDTYEQQARKHYGAGNLQKEDKEEKMMP